MRGKRLYILGPVILSLGMLLEIGLGMNNGFGGYDADNAYAIMALIMIFAGLFLSIFFAIYKPKDDNK